MFLNQSSQSINNNNEMSSFRIKENSFSEHSSNSDTLEENIIKGLNPNFIKNLLTPKKKDNKQKESVKHKKEKNMDIAIKDIFGNEKYVKENSINNLIDNDIININNIERKNSNKKRNLIEMSDYSKNILLMKNIHHKLVNFEENTNVENILIFHLISTIISIPSFSFDSNLLRCNLVLLDNDEKSKYSFLTIFKYHSQEIIKKLKIIENEIKFKFILKDFNLNNNSNNNINNNIKNNSINIKNEFKVGLDFNGFINEEMEEKNKDKNKIVNWVIFYQFIKEIISCISHKYKFEELIDNLFVFYSEQLDEFYNDNINEEEEEIENEDRCVEIENENNYQLHKYPNIYSNTNSNNIEFEDNL